INLVDANSDGVIGEIVPEVVALVNLGRGVTGQVTGLVVSPNDPVIFAAIRTTAGDQLIMIDQTTGRASALGIIGVGGVPAKLVGMDVHYDQDGEPTHITAIDESLGDTQRRLISIGLQDLSVAVGSMIGDLPTNASA